MVTNHNVLRIYIVKLFLGGISTSCLEIGGENLPKSEGEKAEDHEIVDKEVCHESITFKEGTE